jgi:hypothetical protein
MHYICLIFSSFLFIGIAFGHESGSDHHFSYSFKDMVHGMCAGHHHKDDVELKEICNHFSEHFSDILELQSEPPELRTERYITSLTALVIFSDTLTKDQKHHFYRRSYEQAVEARRNGDEWKWLLGMLVERTDALSLPELQDLLENTTHEPMKPLIQKAIDRLQRSSKIRSRPPEQESNKRVGLKDGVEEEQFSLEEEHNRLPWIIAGVVLLGTLVLLLKALKGRTTP